MILTRTYRKPLIILAILTLAALLLAGCTPTEAPPATPEVKDIDINAVEAGGLWDTIAIGIYELDADAGEDAYALRHTIIDPLIVEQVITALDTEIPQQPKVFCMPWYMLQFQLANGGTVDLGLGCSVDDLSMLRSDLEGFQNEDFTAPTAFVDLIKAQLETAANRPDTLDISQALGLDLAVAVELVQQVTTGSDSGLGQNELIGLAYISNPPVVEAILESLRGELPIGPRAECPAEYYVIFHFVEGTKTPLSYGDCGGTVAPFLRGQYGGDVGRDAEAPEAFNALIQEQIRIAQEALPEQ